MPDLNPGQHAPLNVTQESNHRIYAGLGWDPKEDAPGMLEKAAAMVGGKKTNHDLDISCLLYDADCTLLERVSADPEHTINAEGSVYHSGDNEEGLGDGDDEQISVELKRLGHHVHHLMFKIHIKSGHHFGEILSPEAHISDGYSNHRFLYKDLTGEDARGKNTFLFAHIYRQKDGWNIHNISEFFDGPDIARDIIEKHLNMGYESS